MQECGTLVMQQTIINAWVQAYDSISTTNAINDILIIISIEKNSAQN